MTQIWRLKTDKICFHPFYPCHQRSIFFEPNIISLISFIGVALLYDIPLCSKNIFIEQVFFRHTIQNNKAPHFNKNKMGSAPGFIAMVLVLTPA